MTQRRPQETNRNQVPAHLILHQAAPLTAPPPLNGRLDDAWWQTLPETMVCFDNDSPMPRPAALRTSVRAGYDRNGLCFGIRCDDDHAAAIRATIARDGEAFLHQDDCLEFYFAGPDVALDYRQFVVNPLGARKQHRVQANGSAAGVPPGEWRAAATRDARGWSAEVFFPFTELGAGLAGGGGELCRFAVRRYVRSAEGRSAVTAPGAGWGHREAFGWLILTPAGGAPGFAWTQNELTTRIPGDWILPQGRECLWKRHGVVRQAPFTDAVTQAMTALRAEVERMRAAGPEYAAAVTRGEAELKALPPPSDPATATFVLLELQAIESILRRRYLVAEHGIVCRLPGERFGYFGWPTVARRDDGTLLVASSGLRSAHVCPWGKTVLNVSEDNGKTWSAPRVINDSPLDDRDAGIINLGGNKMLVAWFTHNTRQYRHEEWCRKAAEADNWDAVFAGWTDEVVRQWLGSWVMLSADGGTNWGAPIRVPVTTPHGPVRLRNGDLLYFGKRYVNADEISKGFIVAAHSADGGRTWAERGAVPLYPGTATVNYHEPHVVELPSGKLLGMIRVESDAGVSVEAAGVVNWSMMQTESVDGGRTWSVPQPLGFHGLPPHLMRHSSGVLLLTYGFREAPFGQRVAFSRDDGATWEHDWIIRDDGPGGDLGYPSTVELADGSLFTVCYQQAAAGEKCSLLWSRWRLSE